MDFTLYSQPPARVITPATAEDLADCLREASAAGSSVVPWGGGTRQGLGGPPTRYDLALSMSGLSRVVEYTPADLVISVEAGATLGMVQETLAPHGQWLPWDPPLPRRATVGGLLASGAGGMLRLGYGSPRDWTLGMRVALGDGRLVKSGSRVVKNVAGYDSHKLHIGALGTLGVIAEATFKVAPIPPRRQTLIAAFTTTKAPLEAIAQLRQPPFHPISMVILNDEAERAIPALHPFLRDHSHYLMVAVRFAGTAGAVARQIRAAVAHCVELGSRVIELNELDDAPIWEAIADFVQPTGDLMLRVGAPLGQQYEMIRLLEMTTRARGWATARMVIAGVGLAYARWPIAGVPAAALAAALAELRAGLATIGGYVVIEELPAAPGIDRDVLDVWGAPPETLALMRSLRAAWDPAGVLNPGRYLV
ncbi:FAD-binding oxidoreductase [Oscillochloris sp. ZM17-4]|uniref:FAD-binding oxidoreductase n=1 Tax=Oscillochloris sp. ZM17-4 TaxID=2866714 RepID=UPI001C734F98|nr:FAD-binding oxidoreductase [Oscillochloris sp. ZM17-4]MBX0330157.1 FAD-binding oxidoreductase [Oscillochloris sp. ZM17-4]